MRIWGDNPRVFGIYNQQNTVGKIEKSDKVASRKDEYKVSGQAKDFQVVMKALRDIPDIRQDKVREISGKIASGCYKVESKDISDKIIKAFSGND